MTEDEYVESILARYAVPRGPMSQAERLGAAVAGPLRAWAGQQLSSLEYSGSYAKQTGVRGVSDVDLFISLKSDTTGTLGEIYESLYALAGENGWSPRRQNVSIGISVNGVRADLVPGRIQAGYRNYHSLYARKQATWKQTNVAMHIDKVTGSGRVREIRAIKVWRMLHGLEFPSLYLEMFTISALSGRSTSTLAANVLYVLQELGSSLTTTRIIDPANTNNVISDDLSLAEKKLVASQATQSASEPSWGGIIW